MNIPANVLENIRTAEETVKAEQVNQSAQETDSEATSTSSETEKRKAQIRSYCAFPNLLSAFSNADRSEAPIQDPTPEITTDDRKLMISRIVRSFNIHL